MVMSSGSSFICGFNLVIEILLISRARWQGGGCVDGCVEFQSRNRDTSNFKADVADVAGAV